MTYVRFEYGVKGRNVDKVDFKFMDDALSDEDINIYVERLAQVNAAVNCTDEAEYRSIFKNIWYHWEIVEPKI